MKFRLIGTPLERPLVKLRPLLEYRFRRRHPELAEVFEEPARIDEVVRRIVGPGSNCIDIGCHLGAMLNQLLRLAPYGRHMAFEAVPHKAKWLQQRYRTADVRAMALSDERGNILFYENVSRPGYSSMRPPAEADDQFREVAVPCDRLDAVLPEGYGVDFMKVDVEGAELLVFRGAEGVLELHRPILLFECTTSTTQQFGIRPVDVYDLLTGKHRYDIYHLRDWLEDGWPLDREAFETAVVYPFRAFNFLAVPKD